MNTNQIPTTAQMKAALASIQPVSKAATKSSNRVEAVADTIAVGLAGTVTGISDVGVGTINFLDRIKTGYQFKRALDTGKILIDEPAKPARKAK